MSNPTVYVETTVIGYLTSRNSRDLIVAGHQQVTRDWWTEAAMRFELLVSDLVIRECSAGDPQAAQERQLVLRELRKLAPTEAAAKLTEALLREGGVPPTEPRDAAHIALAASHGVQFLVTWNFRHIANAERRGKIERVCRTAGFEPPIICSPENLLEK